MEDQRNQQIAETLLKLRENGKVNWGPIKNYRQQSCPADVANSFFLCCLLDYQMKDDDAWRKGDELIARLTGDAVDKVANLWAIIHEYSEDAWRQLFKDKPTHRFPEAHMRLWHMARKVCRWHGGDVRRIWSGKTAKDVLEELWDLEAGEQISRMIVGALMDCGQISGAGDVKADVHVRRVLGRAVKGEDGVDAESATSIARQLSPENPWLLDAGVFHVGKTYCHAGGKRRPACASCVLKEPCRFHAMNSPA